MIEVSQPKINATVVQLVGSSHARLWGMTNGERLRRAFARAGIDVVHDAGNSAPRAADVVLVRGDAVLDEGLIRGLIATHDVLLGASEGSLPLAAHVDGAHAPIVAAALAAGEPPNAPAYIGLRAVSPAELAGAHNQALRKRAAPLALSLTSTPARVVEWRTFQGAYKGVTDLVTKWVWPRPAFWVTRSAAERAITPNAVTAASFVLVLAALALFASAHFVWGLVAAWAMTFLDTVDGKLARVTLTSSKIGNVFDHGIDLLHPPFWYAAWWRGAAEGSAAAWLEPAMWVVVVGYVVGRLLEGVFLAVFKFEIHSWRPVDSLFRQITARRNPNLILLTLGAAGGRPDLGLLAVAVWTVASSMFHTVRIGQALLARARGCEPASWLEGGEATTAAAARWAA